MIKRTLQAGLVVLLFLTSGVAVYALNQISQLQTAIAEIETQIAPKPSYAMWSVGTGGDGVNPYVEWVALYPKSTLYPIPGAPSLRFMDQAPVEGNPPRDFEIGFYKYGPYVVHPRPHRRVLGRGWRRRHFLDCRERSRRR